MDLLRIAARVATRDRVAGQFLPNGEKIPCAPSAGEWDDPWAGSHVKYRVENVGHLGEKGYDDLRGTVSVDGGPTFTVDAEAYKSGSRYKVLTCDDPSVDPAKYDADLRDKTGFDLGAILANCVGHAVQSYIEANGIEYHENEGPFMDLSIDDNEASDTSEDEGQQQVP